MGRVKPLIRPQLKKIIIGKEAPQKAEYLYISKDFNKKAMKQVLEDGGEQFQEITSLTEMEQEPRFIVITADKLEEGFLAVSLLAGIFNERKEREIWDPDESEEPDVEFGWEESCNRIPIIPYSEASSYYNRNNNVFSPFNNAFTVSQQANDEFVPYWADQKIMPVCIKADYSDLTYMDSVEETLSGFDTNNQVYLLLNDDRGEFGLYENLGEDSINGLILRFTAEEITIPKKRSVSKYYENVWRKMVRQEGYKLERSFHVQELLQDVEKMNDAFSYNLLDQILKYAVRNKKQNILRKEDFFFMERFCGKRKSKGKQDEQRPALQCLREDLIGLEQVKEQVLETVQIMKFNQIRKKMGIDAGEYHNVHVMLGAPGTAKTTVAKLMGKIMEEEQLLPGCQFACVNGAELKGMYVGHSAPKTKALFENNDIIVIDEAYSLAGSDEEPDSFSREAIAQLVIELEEHATDKLVIFAGYGGVNVNDKNNKMKRFIDSNPGIKSRINSTFYFPSYSPKEMTEIFRKHVQMNGYELPQGWQPTVEKYFAERVCDENFGNGREARGLFEKVTVQMAKRVMKIEAGKAGEAVEEKAVRQCHLKDIEHAVERAREENRQLLGTVNARRSIGFVQN